MNTIKTIVFYFIFVLVCDLGLSGIFQAAHADILMFDFNYNPTEVEAARRAAKARGEQLLLFPQNVPPELGQKINQLSTQAAALNVEKEILISERAKKHDPSKSEYYNSKIKEIENQVFDLGEKSRKLAGDYKVTPEKLDSILQKLSNEGKKISSLVISGHDGNGVLHGPLGSITDSDLQKSFGKVSPFGDSIRSLVLWGCYTSNFGSIISFWKSKFPNVELLAGFEEKGPLGDRPAGFSYLEDLLKKEKKLTEIKDLKTLGKEFNKLANVNQLKSSLCVGNNYASKTRLADLNDFGKDCNPEKINKLYEKQECYLFGKPGCTDIPQDTSNGEIRQFYNELQKTMACNKENVRVFILNPKAILNLIFFNTYKTNFERFNKNELKKLDEIGKKIGVPESLSLQNVGSLSRAEIIQRLNKLKEFLDTYFPFSNSKNNPLDPEASVFRQGLQQISSQLGDLSQAPMDWFEPIPSNVNPSLYRINDQEIELFRNNHETARAEADIDKKVQSLKTPSEVKTIEKLNNEIENLYSSIGESESNRNLFFQKKSELETFEKNIFKKNLPQIKSEIERLKSVPYPVEAGKKIYDSVLDSYLRNSKGTENGE